MLILIHRLLFVNFFIGKYITGIRTAPPPPDRKQIARESGKDAAEHVEQEIREAMAEEQSRGETDIPADVIAKLGDAKESLKKSAGDLGSKARRTVKNANDAIRDTVQGTREQAKEWNGKDEGEGKEESWSEKAKKWNDEPKNSESGEQDENVKDQDEQEQSWEAGEREEIESNGLEASAMSYEVNMDEVKDETEQKAEEELQPNGGS